MNSFDKENVFFSLDESDDNNSENIDFTKMLDEINNLDFNFPNQTVHLTDEEIRESMYFEYKINYTVKDLLLICEYYGISKELKTNKPNKPNKPNKCNKEEIISFLINYENNPVNNSIFLKRQDMWYYMSKLKSDKFMKKYVLW